MIPHRYPFGSAPRCLLSLTLTLAAGWWTPTVLAQQHPSSIRAGLEAIQIRPNVHVVFGAGGNVTVHVGEDGLVVVDSGSTDAAEKLLEAIRSISGQPIRLIVNTSADPDHMGGNAILGGAGVGLSPDPFGFGNNATVLAHENTMLRMSLPREGVVPLPAKMWPNDTFTSKFRSMYVNNEAIQVMRQTGAHTDGDAMVLFRKADVLVTGDVLDLRQFPVIDPANGGTIQGSLEALNRLVTELVVPNMPLVLKEGRTLVVPGHGRVSDFAEVVEYRDMVTVIRDRVQSMIDKGQTLAQVKAADPTKGYRGRFGKDAGPWTTEKFVEAVYNGLKGPRS